MQRLLELVVGVKDQQEEVSEESGRLTRLLVAVVGEKVALIEMGRPGQTMQDERPRAAQSALTCLSE